MKKLLMTTALLTALAVAATAQQARDGMIVPEGYSAFDDFSVLTFDSLEGATVYDVNGESIGNISDIVLDMQDGTQGMTDGADMGADAATGGATGNAADTATGETTVTSTETEMNTDATAEMAADPQATGTDSESNVEAGVTGTDPMVDGVDTATGTQSTDPVMTEGLAQGTDTTARSTDPTVDTDTAVLDANADTDMNSDVDNLAEEATLDIAETASDAIEQINDTADQAANQMTDGTDGVTGMVDTTMDETGQHVTMAGGGGISHVIVDIGGFLGIGVHTVALPIEALEIYADGNNDLRIYVPWSEEQLRDLQQYDENNADTLGRMPNAG